MSNPGNPFLTPSEAGELLHLSARHVRRMVAEGTLKGVKVSERRLLIPRAELERLAGGTPLPTAPPAPAREEGELSRDDLRALTSTMHRLAEKLGTAVDRLEAVAETLEGGGE